jgi:hypothetical protein
VMVATVYNLSLLPTEPQFPAAVGWHSGTAVEYDRGTAMVTLVVSGVIVRLHRPYVYRVLNPSHLDGYSQLSWTAAMSLPAPYRGVQP